jgi:hypothetical protein
MIGRPARPLKHRWSIQHNYLAGITAGAWWRLLRENRFAIDSAYWHRAAFITVTSCLNSLYAAREARRYDQQIQQVRITHPPLFILGHWRSGTTLLHYMLAQDDQLFTFANTYEVVNPLTFLTTEEVNSRRFAAMVPETRPMDSMRLSFRTPQEDEFAPLLMSSCSPYLGISFPRREEWYLRYLTLRDVPPEQIQRWKSAFLWFCKKLTFKCNRSLILKSPPHTARIRLLLELFPDARFVHIHRHPFRVFQSQRHYFDTAMWYTYLQQPDEERIDDGIFRRCNILYDAFFEDRPQIADDRFCEIRFDALVADPVGELQTVYRQLNLPGWDQYQPKLETYVQSLAGYRKNTFPPLTRECQQRIEREWSRNFHAWNYLPTHKEED